MLYKYVTHACLGIKLSHITSLVIKKRFFENILIVLICNIKTVLHTKSYCNGSLNIKQYYDMKKEYRT